MRYIEWTKYGGPKVLRVSQKDKPIPKDNELLVRVHATTVTAGDCEIRGLQFPFVFGLIFRIMFGFLRPKGKVLGQEMSGTVEAVGKDVTTYQVGDEIFGSMGFSLGAYSEYMCIPEKPKSGSIALKPANISFEEAAAAPLGGLEAIHFLKGLHFGPDHHVLINGAGGSIGTSVLQMVKRHGAQVTVVDSKKKHAFLASLGADHMIDYHTEDFTKSGQTYDLVFDVVGKSPFEATLKVLKDQGTYVIASPKGHHKSKGRRVNGSSSKRVRFDSANHTQEELLQLKGLLEEGHVKPPIDRVFPMEEIVAAHEYVEAGHKKGNLVISLLGSEDSGQ